VSRRCVFVFHAWFCLFCVVLVQVCFSGGGGDLVCVYDSFRKCVFCFHGGSLLPPAYFCQPTPPAGFHPLRGIIPRVSHTTGAWGLAIRKYRAESAAFSRAAAYPHTLEL
jgi:hypothetical protein